MEAAEALPPPPPRWAAAAHYVLEDGAWRMTSWISRSPWAQWTEVLEGETDDESTSAGSEDDAPPGEPEVEPDPAED